MQNSGITSIFKRYGFKIHPDKIKLMPHSKEQESLGIRLNDGIGVTSAYLQKYRVACQRYGASDPKCKGMKAYIDGLRR